MAEIRIDGVIGTSDGEVSSSMVRAMLPEDQTQDLKCYIHSEGGSVFEGFAIYDILDKYPGKKTAVIESSAFSIASFIPMAFDEIEITPNGYMMIHNPYMETEGDDEDLAKGSATLKDLKDNMIAAYSRRTGKGLEEVAAMLKAETYMNATKAVQLGFCDRITSKPVHGRVFAKLNNMPHGVVSALFGAGSDGDKVETKEKPMTTNPRVAATVKQIKSAFPKAKADFVIRCMEKEMPMEEVGAEYSEELEKENETLSAKVKAMEDELTALKAKAMEEELAKAKAMEEEEPAAQKPVARGVAPVAKASGNRPVAAAIQWNKIVGDFVAQGMTKAKAAQRAVREHRDVHQQMIAEANA